MKHNIVSSMMILPRIGLLGRSRTTQCGPIRGREHFAATRSISNLAVYKDLEDELQTSWVRQHLFTMGLDLIKLKLYQKLSGVLVAAGGGYAKYVVAGVSNFIKEELRQPDNDSRLVKEIQEIVQSYCDDVNMETLASKCGTGGYNTDFRKFFMTVGYMIIHEPERNLNLFTDRIIDLYLNHSRASSLEKSSSRSNRRALQLMRQYYLKVGVNYHKLYRTTPRYITMHGTRSKISLPELPVIHNKHLLAKCLIHKEMTRALLLPNHEFSLILKRHNISIDRGSFNSIRHDISFLDGLGDFFLARESSHLLYEFGKLNNIKNNHFGKKSYCLLRTILSTNTLLAELALAYGLHQGLNDIVVYRLLRQSYVPNLNKWKNGGTGVDDEIRKYEQEFIADYFEQYVGALFLEQPAVAQKWITDIYKSVLRLFSEEHKQYSSGTGYDYNLWCEDIIGRRLMKKRTPKEVR